MNWYYVDGPLRVGPLTETEREEAVRSGKIKPETLVWHGDLDKWTPYREVAPEPEPEEEEEPEEEPAAMVPGKAEADPERFAAQILEQDYEVRLGRCFKQTLQLLRGHFGMLLGSTALAYLLIFVGNNIQGLNLVMALALNGVLMGGLYSIYLRLMRGEQALPVDLFSGFEPGVFRNLALKTLVAGLALIACFIPAAIALTVTGVDFSSSSPLLNIDPLTLAVLLLIFLACTIPAAYLGFCWTFAIPLIVEKRMPYRLAMRLSRKKVLQHPWRVSILVTVAGLMAVLPGFMVAIALILSGVFAKIGAGTPDERVAAVVMIGMIFTAPLYIGMVLYLYRAIFSEPHPKPESAESGNRKPEREEA